MRLHEFISANLETILKEWENFARANQPSEANLKTRELRDHARAMLENIAGVLKAGRSLPDHSIEPADSRDDADSAAEVHADERLDAGFSISLLVAEYRSLRASVLRLWFSDTTVFSAENADDIVRFNEALDHTLTESVARYSESVLENSDLFVGMLGHDLRSPLQVIEFGADKLKKLEDADDKPNKMAPVVNGSLYRMKMMLDNLMDFTESRIGKGVRISIGETDAAEITRNLVDEFRSVHDDCRFQHHAYGDCTGNWDGLRVGQICQNLIGNALQHGAEQGEISVTCEGTPDAVVLTVKNDGEPIPLANQKVIFELANRKHYQAGNPNKNLGLGLYIVRELVKAHHGDISVTSAADTGTVFRVELPKASALATRHLASRI
ncbi:sensor histidine kinase [Halopseudomonas salegens]|uniref:histidine kinase n=1 Tax=Halopseudomonas salegens TaxID=1434072 RepID=A0A1H2HYE8_9GAMM|nr:sensor histidine kinase [Halopseudomonas salegens]SDU36779.1 hypothetical protein SAMN05216210_3403 [Halopseudomonas salegens]